MSNTESKVRELAKLSILSDRISEFHEENLQTYPFIFFNGVKEAKIDYNLKRGEKNYVSYDIALKDGSENPSLEKRLESLDKSIKNLFWKEVSVSVYLNGKKTFDSATKETIEEVATRIMDENRGLFEDLAKLEEEEKKAKNNQG